MIKRTPFQVCASLPPQPHENQPTSVCFEKNQQNIANRVPTISQPRLHIASQLSKKIYVLYTIKMMSSRIVVSTGTFMWPNGEKIVLQQAFLETFFYKANQKARGKYHCLNSYDSQGLRIRVKDRALQTIQCFQDYSKSLIKTLNKKMKEVAETLEEVTGRRLLDGPSKIWKKKFQIKRNCLESYKKINNLLKQEKLIVAQNNVKNDNLFVSSSTTSESYRNPLLINYLKKIEETDEMQDQPFYQRSFPQSLKFKIETKICHLHHKNSSNNQISGSGQKTIVQKNLAIKRVDPEEKNSKRKVQLNREIHIIESIKTGKQYFLDYFLPENKKTQQEALYMENVPDTLSFYSRNQLSNLEENFTFFRDIAQGMRALHNSGVVHRDLKPQNVLMPDLAKSQRSSTVKIIDLSDSSLVSEPFTEDLSKKLGCTLPYSPIECKYRCDMGVKSPNIDLWSLGVVLFEILNGRAPEIENKIWLHLQADKMFPEFKEGFKKEEFYFNPYHRKITAKTSLCWVIQKLAPIIMVKLLKLKPDERLNLDCIISIAREMELCIQTILTIM